MKNLSERSNAYWSGRAPEFSALRMNEFASVARQSYEDFLLEFLPAKQEPLEALDIGTGAGFFALILQKLGCRVTAVDFSPEMLVQARKNATERGGEGIDFRQMDAQNLTFADNSFDFVITRNVMWIVEDAQRMYFHMHRVLRPGGILLNLDANYGKAFWEADQKKETPTHPTQTLEQLRERNEIAGACQIAWEKRPGWDVAVLSELGVRHIRIEPDLDRRLGLAEVNRPYSSASTKTKASMFAVAAEKA